MLTTLGYQATELSNDQSTLNSGLAHLRLLLRDLNAHIFAHNETGNSLIPL